MKMRMRDDDMEVGEANPKSWLIDAYLRMGESLELLMNLGITKDEVKEMEDYLKNTDDEMGNAIWLIANYDAKNWMKNEGIKEDL
jgi:hypothetical protein